MIINFLTCSTYWSRQEINNDVALNCVSVVISETEQLTHRGISTVLFTYILVPKYCNKHAEPKVLNLDTRRLLYVTVH